MTYESPGLRRPRHMDDEEWAEYMMSEEARHELTYIPDYDPDFGLDPGPEIEEEEVECVRCGNTVTIEGFTNTCDECGADYNWQGNLLARREDWGEETGESLADIIGPE